MRGLRNRFVLSALVFATSLVVAAAYAARTIVEDKPLPEVSLQQSVGTDGSISGTIVNHSLDTLKDVRVLVRHAWRWNDETHPGDADANPGRADYFTVQGPVPPGDSISFQYQPDPPLNPRPDVGKFSTSAQIVSFVQVHYPSR